MICADSCISRIVLKALQPLICLLLFRLGLRLSPVPFFDKELAFVSALNAASNSLVATEIKVVEKVLGTHAFVDQRGQKAFFRDLFELHPLLDETVSLFGSCFDLRRGAPEETLCFDEGGIALPLGCSTRDRHCRGTEWRFTFPRKRSVHSVTLAVKLNVCLRDKARSRRKRHGCEFLRHGR